MNKLKALKETLKQHNLLNEYDSTYFEQHLKISEFVFNAQIQKQLIFINRYRTELCLDFIGNRTFTKLVILNVGLGVNRSTAYKYAKIWNELEYKVVLFDSETWMVNGLTQNGTSLKMDETSLLLILYKELSKKYNIIGYHGVKFGATSGANYISEFSDVLPFSFYVLDTPLLIYNKSFNSNLRKQLKKSNLNNFFNIQVDLEELKKCHEPILAVYSADTAQKNIYGYNELYKNYKYSKNWLFLETTSNRYEPIFSNWDKYKKYLKNITNNIRM